MTSALYARVAGIALGASALFVAAERDASACVYASNPCALAFTPALGKRVPANIGTILVTPGTNAPAVVKSLELLGPDDAPVAVTVEHRPGLVLVTPQAELAPGRHRIIATAEQLSGCAEPQLGGAVIESDAGVAAGNLLFRHESSFIVVPSVPLPTTAGTVTLGERRIAGEQDTDDPVFSYPVHVTVSPEMLPFVPSARWTVELDGKPRRHGEMGDEAPEFELHVRCKSQAPLNSCAQDVDAPGPHKVRVVARLAGSDTPIASDELDVELSCDAAVGSSTSSLAASSSDSGSGCNVVTRPSSIGAGSGLALFGVAGVLTRLRRRLRRS